MMTRLTSRIAFAACLLAFALVAMPVAAQPCTATDNGTGTVNLPPDGCDYLSPANFHMIVNGLPAGTTIIVDASHERFLSPVVAPGGNLGGEVETFQSTLNLTLTGTGDLAGFSRTIFMNSPNTEVHTAPRTPGDPVQDFDAEMVRINAEIFGDPDFDFLSIKAGSGVGLLPSPGHTTLTRLPSGDWNVDSFFDITYQIDFQGAPGSILEGFAGTTVANLTMQGGEPAPPIPPCTVVDNGSGTIDLPPVGCGYVSPFDLHMMIDGLPPGTAINVGAEHAQFFGISQTPGGSLGGEIETFDSNLLLNMTGTDVLAGFNRTINMQAGVVVHSGPRSSGSPQTFDTEMISMQGEIFGDPDFDFLRITAGTAQGLPDPSPGSTTLTQLPSGNWNVDSFFDITYQIDYQGAPGSVLEGLSGTTQGTLRMQTGAPLGDCPPLPSGQDVFPSTAKLVVDLLNDSAEPFVVRLSSANRPDTIVQRQPEAGGIVPIEMVQLDLHGFHPRLGQVHVQLEPGQVSLGEIRNIVQDPISCELISADSFFDVFTEISLVDLGQTLLGRAPLHLESKLIALPPRNIKYENPFLNPVIFFDPGSNQDVAEVLTHLHHVDPPLPPGGNDCFNTFLSANVNLPPLGFFGQVQAQGPTTVLRSGPSSPGNGNCCNSGGACAVDSDCPGTDTCCDFQQIDTEMVQLDLTGFDPLLGEFNIRQRPAPPSAGQVQTLQSDRTYVVDSFFDVVVDISLTDQGLTLHNDEPIRVSAPDGLTNIPPDPGTQYVSPPAQPIPLVLDDGTPIGDISGVTHVVEPPFDWQPPPPPDEDCFDSWVHLEITIFNPFCQETLWLPGVFRVLRDAPADPAGIGQEIIDTLMAKGVFSANSTCVGALEARLSSDDATPSEGSVSSLTPQEFFPADSFFDIMVEMDTGIGTLNAGPSHMTTTINALPPDDGEIYFGPGTVIPLFDDAGSQIGEILEVQHEIHRQVECPGDCKATINEFGVFEDDGTNRAIVFNKNKMDVGIPKGGGGVKYDVVRGDLSVLRASGGLFLSAGCLQIDGGKLVAVAADPLPGDGFYYVARDGFKAYNGTWNAPGVVTSRDPLLNPICPP